MQNKINVICATLLIASACDEAELLAEEVAVESLDPDEHERTELRTAPVSAGLRDGLTTAPASMQGLDPGQVLYKGDSRTSDNGVYTLILQEDGNLVLYIAGGAHALWASGTHGQAVSRCIMQGDGNLVIYGYPNAIWASNTWGHPGARLVVQDDGNVVIYSTEGKALWATDTWH